MYFGEACRDPPEVPLRRTVPTKSKKTPSIQEVKEVREVRDDRPPCFLIILIQDKVFRLRRTLGGLADDRGNPCRHVSSSP